MKSYGWTAKARLPGGHDFTLGEPPPEEELAAELAARGYEVVYDDGPVARFYVEARGVYATVDVTLELLRDVSADIDLGRYLGNSLDRALERAESGGYAGEGRGYFDATA